MTELRGESITASAGWHGPAGNIPKEDKATGQVTITKFGMVIEQMATRWDKQT